MMVLHQVALSSPCVHLSFVSTFIRIKIQESSGCRCRMCKVWESKVVQATRSSSSSSSTSSNIRCRTKIR